MENQKLVTIIVPNFRTRMMTELCLNNIRCYTDLSKADVIAVDNDSRDESTDYLRSLDWIRLIERRTDGENGPEMHAKALDEAMEQVKTPYVLVIHTDTIVLRPDWLEFLLGKIEGDARIGAVGSWKLEYVSPVRRFFKRLEGFFHRFKKKKPLNRTHYFRSHCALYRTELLRACRSRFSSGDSAGIDIFNELAAKGYLLPFIESEELCRYVRHLNHATAILNPVPGARKTNSPALRRKLLKELEAMRAGEKHPQGN